jgi:hypothetical protein
LRRRRLGILALLPFMHRRATVKDMNASHGRRSELTTIIHNENRKTIGYI